VVLDCAPGWDIFAINTLFFANEVLAPTSLEGMSIRGLILFIQRVEEIGQLHDVTIIYVVPTSYDRRVKQSDELLDQLGDHFGQVLTNPIRINVLLSETTTHGLTIFEYDSSSAGAKDYEELTGRVLSDE